MSLIASVLGYNLQTFLVFLAVFLFAYNYLKKSEWKGLPPGPFCFPLLGTLPYLGVDLREPLRKMGKKYGDLFTIYLGTRRVVVLNDYDVIKEAFIKLGNHFSDRPPIYMVSVLTKGYGLICASGEFWREQRRFAYNTFRDFGLGRSIFQDQIIDESKCLVDHIRKEYDGKAFEPKFIVSNSVSNIICSVVFGKRFEYTDKVFKKYMQILSSCVDIVSNNGILTVFPWLPKILPGDLFQEKTLIEQKEYMDVIYHEFIDKHRESMDTSQPPKDYIDAYLRAYDQEKDAEGTSFSIEQLVRSIGDLFVAGTETTGTTLLWGIIYMMKNPDAQEKVQEEIDDVLEGREPRFEDRELLPYTEACIYEIQRMGDITPLAVPHCTNEDVQLRGYTIPKGTMILPNFYSVHRDEKVFPNPFEFRPERFLDSEGKISKKEQLAPFSVGRRMCLGEGLARMELFLFFTTLMQNFTFTLPEGHKMPSVNGRVGMTHCPRSFYTCATPRN